jgi:outer membrane protein
VEQAYINITTTYKRYMTLQEQSAAYAESFRIAGIRFENGVNQFIRIPDRKK